MSEGFGDYWAVTVSAHAIAPTPDPACVGDWDSTSYTSSVPRCLRRVNLNLHYPADLEWRSPSRWTNLVSSPVGHQAGGWERHRPIRSSWRRSSAFPAPPCATWPRGRSPPRAVSTDAPWQQCPHRVRQSRPPVGLGHS